MESLLTLFIFSFRMFVFRAAMPLPTTWETMTTLRDCCLLSSQNDDVCQNIQVSSLWCFSRLVGLHFYSIKCFSLSQRFPIFLPLFPKSREGVSRCGYFGKEHWRVPTCLADISTNNPLPKMEEECTDNSWWETNYDPHLLALHSHNIQAHMFHSLQEYILVTSFSGPNTKYLLNNIKNDFTLRCLYWILPKNFLYITYITVLLQLLFQSKARTLTDICMRSSRWGDCIFGEVW